MDDDTTGPDAGFQARVADGRLWLQHCRACAQAVFYPRILCPVCHSTDLEWRPASGLGQVYSHTTILSRPAAGQTEPGRHVIVLVDLDEGPRMMSHLPGTPPKTITIGLRVHARITGEPGHRAVVFASEKVA
jgi:uncharacterized OB-fold protein